MNFTTLLPILLASVGSQETAFATSELTTLLTAENIRVKAGLTADQISSLVAGIVALAFAEQNALVTALTTKTAPVAPVAVKKEI